MNIWQFMSDSPWLTFFIALILAETIQKIVKYVRGCKKPHPESCPMCGLSFAEKPKKTE